MHRKLALIGVVTLLGTLVLATPALATNHCRIAVSAATITAGGIVTVTGTGYTVGSHILVTVPPGAAANLPVPEVMADGTISFTVGPLNNIGVNTVTVEAHLRDPGSEVCAPTSATVTVTAAAAPTPAPTPVPPGATPAPATPAPSQTGTGTLPDAALIAPDMTINVAALGLVLLASAAALWAVQVRRHRAG